MSNISNHPIHQPRLARGPTDTKQQRSVASRKKTGCLTCKRRHIKCDEAKPICIRCKSTNRYCGGPAYQDRPQLPSSIRPTNERDWEIVPKGWEAVEASEYYNTVMVRNAPKDSMVPKEANDTVSRFIIQASPNGHSGDIFLLFTLSSRIATVSTQNGIAKRPSNAYGTMEMWKKLFSATQAVLQSINQTITLVTASTNSVAEMRDLIFEAGIMMKIFNVMVAEDYLDLPEWKLHRNGYFAMLNLLGKPQDCTRADPRFWGSLQRIVWGCTIANTVSIPSNMFRVLYSLDVPDIVSAIARQTSVSFRCPSKLFVQIFTVTRLRVNLLSKDNWNDDIAADACSIFDTIRAFDPHNWEETYFIPDIPGVSLIPKISWLSTSLFTLLSLRMEDSIIGRECLAAHGVDRISLRNELLEAMMESDQYPFLHLEFTWELAVLAVAFVDGEPTAKTYIYHRLSLGRKSFFFQYGLEQRTIRRVVKFWASGKTGWDDCWDEPYIMW